MRTTLDKLVSNMDNAELLDIFVELESGKVPATSYSHDFCRRVNKMIDDGELSVNVNGFRHIYLPSLRKIVYKEMATRYAFHLQNYRGPVQVAEASTRCDNCGLLYNVSELRETEYGLVCDRCYDKLVKPDED